MRLARNWQRSLQGYWYRADKEAWLFVLILGLLVTIFSLVLRAVFAYQDERRDLVRQAHRQDLTCLARNIYYEARGEPIAGQYAVAEVTLNRKASGRYPKTICEVVHQQNWDPIRGRYVGAFSWTEFDELPAPGGEEWQRAWRVAEAVYYQKHIPVLQGALFYHANYVEPDWARQKRAVAKIGRHIFYR
jgi:spore germination cell wall hydrolase CwlJ-like protein